MPTIAFACPHCGDADLEAHLGTVAQFSPPTVDDPAQWAEITRRRQEYIGRQVMQAIVTHVLYGPCTALPLEECTAVQPHYLHKCNRAKGHKGDHMVQADHPSAVRIVARWPQLEVVPGG